MCILQNAHQVALGPTFDNKIGFSVHILDQINKITAQRCFVCYSRRWWQIVVFKSLK